ncbi:unnamed protein product [Pleuronectes platessa]|uniref:Uncharacterized protein n=1 Tax=Pleuronectes platessa TaxID=8262 RepID=A0A9N7W004_PLEPL|nr:unnamed protein product [Pleuronectes platessa]
MQQDPRSRTHATPTTQTTPVEPTPTHTNTQSITVNLTSTSKQDQQMQPSRGTSTERGHEKHHCRRSAIPNKQKSLRSAPVNQIRNIILAGTGITSGTVMRVHGTQNAKPKDAQRHRPEEPRHATSANQTRNAPIAHTPAYLTNEKAANQGLTYIRYSPDEYQEKPPCRVRAPRPPLASRGLTSRPVPTAGKTLFSLVRGTPCGPRSPPTPLYLRTLELYPRAQPEKGLAPPTNKNGGTTPWQTSSEASARIV